MISRKHLLPVVLMTSLLLLQSCGMGGYSSPPPPPPPAQGPANPSFETAGQGAGVVAMNWLSDSYTGGCLSQPAAARLTGTGFMPTNGQYYVQLYACQAATCTTCSSADVYQDSVDLSTSKNLIFDFSGNGNGTAEILFTQNGTVTLWSMDFNGTQVNMLNQTVPLPTLPTPGRITVQVSRPAGGNYSSLAIDNFRVQ